MIYIIILIAFIWLGYETDWMRVRLLVGVDNPTIEYQYKTWEELKPLVIKKGDPGWLRFPDTIAPLTGWDWLFNTRHIIPEYKIELISEHAKYTIRSESAPALRDAFRVYRNPYLKIKLT